MANKDPEELAIDGHNYPTWASDMKLSLSSRGLLPVLNEQPENAQLILDYIKASALLLLGNNIHSDLKTEYLMEENPRTLWLALKRRYEQRKECNFATCKL